METLTNVVSILEKSDNTAVLTGAGISKAAGIPTFRDIDGLWRQDGLMSWANRRSFDMEPGKWFETFWKLYNKRQGLVPSLAHLALSDLVAASEVDTVITQNIDGLDLQAGTPPAAIFEIHGHDRSLSCTTCEYRTPTDMWLAEHDVVSLPLCPDSHTLKPDILLFGPDSVPGLDTVHEAALGSLGKADTLIIVGTSLEIPYVAEWVFDFADTNKSVIVINPQRTLADSAANLIIRESSEEILPRIRDLVIN